MTQTPTPGGTTWTAGSFNAKNQVADANWVYDNAGNVVGAGTGGAMLQYDAENRLVKACGASSCTAFSYDAAGNRVQRTDASSQSTTTTFVYDAFGNLAADYGAPANAPGTQYVAVDAMGSTRLVMDGTAVERHDFEPYGAELSGGWRTPALGYVSATVRQRFRGQERDDETTLDYFLARYYSGTQGRFGSPDPGNAGANPADPQSWNGYAYVSGNPLTYTDPSGQFAEAAGLIFGLDNPVGWAIDAAVVAGTIADLLFGGGSKPDLSSVAWTPGPVQPLTGGGGSSMASNFAIFNLEDGTQPQTTGQFFRSYWSTAGFLYNFATGTGPRIRYYGPNDYRTRDLMSSKGFQVVNQQIKQGCQAGKANGTLNLSTWQGAKDIPYDIFHSPVGGEVGGYNGTWSTSGGTTQVNIVNYAGAYSFFYHKVNDRAGTSGPFRTIKQTFVIKEPSPCGK